MVRKQICIDDELDAALAETARRLGVSQGEVVRRALRHEIDRMKGLIPKVHLNREMTRDEFTNIRDEFDYVVIATGAQKPRMLPLPGIERALPALDFLRAAKANLIRAGNRVVVIGAGNVGMDICVEAWNHGAAKVTAVDIQKPASFGKEQKMARARGTELLFPKFTALDLQPRGGRGVL